MKVGIVGATGAVGEELLLVLESKKDVLKVKGVRLFASERSEGKVVTSKVFGNLTIEAFSLERTKDLDYVFMAVSGSFAQEYAPQIASMGPVVVDNSSAFRYDPAIPLVIPEINGHVAKGAKIIANPNCTTAIAAMALWPIHQKFGIKKLIISTYQAASGAGAEGMQELQTQAKDFCHNKALETKVFQYPLLFNVIPHIDAFQENQYTREEMKVVWETRKIFGCPDIDVSCTCVRIPTLRAHAEAITIETELPVDPEQVKALLRESHGVELVDDTKQLMYPMPLNASKKYDVEAGRVRRNLVFGNRGIDLFVCGDQLLRGAALNAVLIAEYMEKADYAQPKTFTPSALAKFTSKRLDMPQVLALTGIAALAGALLSARLLRDA